MGTALSQFGTNFSTVDLGIRRLLILCILDDGHLRADSKQKLKAVFSLKHPNLVKVHDFGVLENGYLFFSDGPGSRQNSSDRLVRNVS